MRACLIRAFCLGLGFALVMTLGGCLGSDDGARFVHEKIRGVPVLQGGEELTLFTGRVAVTVQASNPERLARRLRPLDRPGDGAGDLPPPVYAVPGG